MKKSEIQKALAYLREAVPLPHAVKLVWANLGSRSGECVLREELNKPPRFLIRLDSGLSADARKLVLVHEYAHALSWHLDNAQGDDHGIAWGLSVSVVWTALHQAEPDPC